MTRELRDRDSGHRHGYRKLYLRWGNPLTTTGTLATTLGTLNPLRYRGYVYDSETGFYYLQSRYYDPRIGRFINADAYASTGQGLLGNNMFAYCRNNPVSRQDVSGFADESDFDCTPNLDERKDDGKASTGSTGPVPTGSVYTGPQLTFLGGKAAPNPGGRLGGTLHRTMIDALKHLFKALGFEVSPKEKRVVFDEQGNYRYPDITIIDPSTGNDIAYAQVGKSKVSGDPIAREDRAKLDLEKTGLPVFFFPYDK